MYLPRPFDLAIVFDKGVKAEYQKGTLERLVAGRPMLECFDAARNPVYLVNGVQSEEIRREERNLWAAAIGLVPHVQNTSACVLGYVIELTHKGKTRLTAVAQKFVVQAPF